MRTCTKQRCDITLANPSINPYGTCTTFTNGICTGGQRT